MEGVLDVKIKSLRCTGLGSPRIFLLFISREQIVSIRWHFAKEMIMEPKTTMVAVDILKKRVLIICRTQRDELEALAKDRNFTVGETKVRRNADHPGISGLVTRENIRSIQAR